MRCATLGIVAACACALTMFAGCNSSSQTKTAPHTDSQTTNQSCIMQSGGKDVLRIALAGANCSRADGSLHIESANREKTNLWHIAGARTIDDGVAQIPNVIVSEFRGFTETSGEVYSTSGVHGKRVRGTGVEADDNDPGFADVIVFEVGGKIFAACTHGETILKSDQDWMVKVVQAAKAP